MDAAKYSPMAYAMFTFFIIIMLLSWAITLSVSLLTTKKCSAFTRSIVHSVLGLLLPAIGIIIYELPALANYQLPPTWDRIHAKLWEFALTWITLSIPCSLLSLIFTAKTLKSENGRAKQILCSILTGLCTGFWAFVTVSYLLKYR